MTWRGATGSIRKLIINGYNITLDGQKTYQFMTINTGYTLILENITTTNGKTTIKAQITDETGSPLTSSTKVVIKINGKTIASTTSINGTIDTSFITTLNPGTYELSIVSGENGQYQKSTMTTVLKI